jgi:protein-disulfide isomerase
MSITKKLLASAGVLCVLAIAYVVFHNQYLSKIDINEQLHTESTQALLALQPDDHVYGNRNAPIKMIMYSDATCQYCRWLYPDLLEVVDSYPDGQVALVYRYIPIYRTRDTVSESEKVAECVAEQLGDTGFFTFKRNLFARLPSNQQLDSVPFETVTVPALQQTGVDQAVVMKCVETFSKYDRVLNNHSSGGALGVIQIPQTFIVSGETVWDIVRAQPSEVYRSAIDALLVGKEPTS